ncbi:MAG TPA: efflux RND transporter periplasmic adaptor subunit [Bacteroidota bacterium]|jgi:HlyD family secretion protein|nr:efflux RND transporter periplasmic adaptor subunit [Bacteroidota bacterium]
MRSLLLLAALFFVAGCSKDDKNNITASGTIEGTETTIAAEVAGKIKDLRADEGTRVKTGDTLLVIDDTDFQIQLRQALANEDAAVAQYKLTVEGPRKEDIAQAEAAFKNAEEDFKRMESLLASHTVTQKQYDDAKARYVSAEQGYRKLQTGSRQEEILGARARREQAQAQSDQLRKKIRDCNVVSPSDGVVSVKSVERGEFVTVGANLLRVTYLQAVKLTIYVGESDLGSIRLGQTASVTIDTYKDSSFAGTVNFISSTAEFTPKNVQTKEERSKLVFAVKLLIDNPHGILKPGMPADAALRRE